MRSNSKFILITILVFICYGVKGQQTADTLALIKTFDKVMAFIKQPYLYYTTSSKLSSEPVLSVQDTMLFTSTCYKQFTDLYYSNNSDETFIEDSLFIKINHQRKTVWISKVDAANKEKLTNNTTNLKQLQDMMRKRYTISKLETDKAGIAKLQFVSTQAINGLLTTTTTLILDYEVASYLPKAIEMVINIRQPLTDELAAMIKSQNMHENELVKVIDGNKYILRKQTMFTVFTTIETDKSVVSKMPKWNDVLDFNAVTKAYTSKGVLANYTITKMF
ncbi:MAG: hypothetical protein QM541_01475 [Flavobacterium sp.]|nr:hypothetical protein [Flavobacterium sp.]